jgi:hypothetical protein
MDLVSNQFSMMKSMIDMQAMTRSSAPISSMITLGSRDLPYFITAKSFGELSTNEDNSFKIIIEPPPIPSLPFEFSPTGNTTPLTSIKYTADNSYFVDQTYIFEGGGLIVQQPDGIPVMRADPSISAVNNTNIEIHFDLPYIIAVPGKNITSGDGNCFIRTNYSSNRTHITSPPLGGYIRIYTAYPNAWNESLFKLLGIYADNGCIHINWVSAQPTDYIEIMPGLKKIYLELNVIIIYVQIGQGWIQ